MKKLFFVGVALVSLLAAYTLGTFKARKVIALPPAQWVEQSEAAQAWREFAVALEAAGARVFERSEHPADRLEGLQYLAQLAAVSLEMKLAKGSAVEPRFTDWMADHRKFLGDSPEAVYHSAQLSPKYRYEVTGHRGDAEYLGLALYGKQLNGWNRAAQNIADDHIRFDAQGNFRVVLSATAPAEADTDWLPLDDDVHMIMVRQYYHGRGEKQLATLSIRNLDAPAYSRPGDAEVARGLRAATTLFSDTVDGAIALTTMLADAPNSFDPPASYSPDFGGIFYPTKDNEYYGGWFRLDEDEALIIEGAVPDAPYWELSLQNLWMQSLDYERYPVGLNDKQITTENGRYRVVLSHQPPPSGNWLSTTGKREGLLSIRYQRARQSKKPSLRVVKFSEL